MLLRSVTRQCRYPNVRTSQGAGTVSGVYTKVAFVVWLGSNVPFLSDVVLKGDGPVAVKLKRKFGRAIVHTKKGQGKGTVRKERRAVCRKTPER